MHPYDNACGKLASPQKTRVGNLRSKTILYQGAGACCSNEQTEANAMNAVEVQTHAHKLFAAHGPKALAEAAEKVREYEAAGDQAKASDWKRIESALRNIKDPIAS